MSYRKKHIKNKIYKIKPKKTIFQRLWFWISLLVFAAILSVFYFVFFYSGFQVSNVVVSGNERINAQDLEKIVFENTKSIFLVNESNLNDKILEKFPIIEKLKVGKKFPQTITLGIQERKPVGAFCSVSGQCFLIDQNGIIFDLLSSVPKDATIVRKVEKENNIFPGEEVLSPDIMVGIYAVQKSLKDNFQIDVREAFITSPIRLNMLTSENWKIYFDIDQNSDINMQITKLNLLLKDEITSASRENLRYIDLRPKDRAIICDNATCGG